MLRNNEDVLKVANLFSSDYEKCLRQNCHQEFR